jgi:hypothetical protein
MSRFRRAIERRALGWPKTLHASSRTCPLDDALRLVELHAIGESPKFEPAARRWLGRCLEEQAPTLVDFAQTARLAERPLP